MNQKNTGNFIRELRKEKGITQKELAERLHVSEKTVSKWETGNGLPEVSLFLPLCEQLNITVNEFLSGERLNGEAYKKHADANIVSLMHGTSAKSRLIVCIVCATLSIGAVFAMVMIAGFAQMEEWLRTALLLIATVGMLTTIALILVIALNTEIFECAKCKREFVPTPRAYIMAPHSLTRRYLRCPHCNRKNWNKVKYKDVK